MFRWIGICLVALAAELGSFGNTQAPANGKPPAEVREELPPEEDTAAKPKEYTFNPLQASTELRVGNYYFKRGKYRAAAERFHEATLWNPQLAEAFERLGAADEKQHDRKGAREAYTKYLEIAPDAKDVEQIRKKLSKL